MFEGVKLEEPSYGYGLRKNWLLRITHKKMKKGILIYQLRNGNEKEWNIKSNILHFAEIKLHEGILVAFAVIIIPYLRDL